MFHLNVHNMDRDLYEDLDPSFTYWLTHGSHMQSVSHMLELGNKMKTVECEKLVMVFGHVYTHSNVLKRVNSIKL